MLIGVYGSLGGTSLRQVFPGHGWKEEATESWLRDLTCEWRRSAPMKLTTI